METIQSETGEPYSLHRGGIYNYFQGATINNFVYQGTIKQSGPVYLGQSAKEKELPHFSEEQMSKAIVKCQPYFWSMSAYAVVFCICRDIYKQKYKKTDFEEKIEKLPYQGKRTFICSPGTIANAFSKNSIFNEYILDWEKYNAPARLITLRNELMRALNLPLID